MMRLTCAGTPKNYCSLISAAIGDYLRTLRVVEACYESNSKGQVVRLTGSGAPVDDDGLQNERRESGLSQ
ncbi:MAG: hypothetical protein WD423_12555 [Rhodothermales bacterium]